VGAAELEARFESLNRSWMILGWKIPEVAVRGSEGSGDNDRARRTPKWNVLYVRFCMTIMICQT